MFNKTVALLCLTLVLAISCSTHNNKVSKNLVQPNLGFRSVEILKEGSFQFKDLNKNHKLDNYEDWRLPTEERVKDLVAQMTLEEKIGFMLISTTRMAGDNVFEANTPILIMGELNLLQCR